MLDWLLKNILKNQINKPKKPQQQLQYSNIPLGGEQLVMALWETLQSLYNIILNICYLLCAYVKIRLRLLRLIQMIKEAQNMKVTLCKCPCHVSNICPHLLTPNSKPAHLFLQYFKSI